MPFSLINLQQKTHILSYKYTYCVLFALSRQLLKLSSVLTDHTHTHNHPAYHRVQVPQKNTIENQTQDRPDALCSLSLCMARENSIFEVYMF